jgi:hypothetical protein
MVPLGGSNRSRGKCREKEKTESCLVIEAESRKEKGKEKRKIEWYPDS